MRMLGNLPLLLQGPLNILFCYFIKLIFKEFFTQKKECEGVSWGRQVKAALLVKLEHWPLGGGGHYPGRGAVCAGPGEGGGQQEIIFAESTKTKMCRYVYAKLYISSCDCHLLNIKDEHNVITCPVVGHRCSSLHCPWSQQWQGRLWISSWWWRCSALSDHAGTEEGSAHREFRKPLGSSRYQEHWA